MKFETILYLDDVRIPLIMGIDIVRSYDQFVWYINNKSIPDLISFDHDLAFEHYPVAESRPNLSIPYEKYKEKTGYDCAKYIVENNLPLKYWNVHSMNNVGSNNIRQLLRKYNQNGEAFLKIPYSIKTY